VINRLRRVVSSDLRGQVAAILLLGLILSQLIAAILYVGLIPRWQRVQRPDSAITRIEMVTRMLEAAPNAQRPRVALWWSEPNYKLDYLTGVPLKKTSLPESSDDQELHRGLAERLRKPMSDVWVEPWPNGGESETKRVQIAFGAEGSLEIIAAIGLEHRLGVVAEVGIALFVVFATVGLWAWLTWMVNAPLSRVAASAEQVGFNIQSPPLEEQGPAQLRRVIRALNSMQRRLQRFLLDRTSMLGAISHDLRTPLTRLRLRIENNRIVDERSKMLQDIASMEQMLNSTLSFVRGVDDTEPQETVDLVSLIQTACDTVADLGGDVRCTARQPCRYRCKPHALLRALINVIGNAVKHGGSARVALHVEVQSGIIVDVDDQGPGIPHAEKEKVFEPFYRAKTSMDDDGMGLGLAIARSVVLGHGGSIELVDLTPSGLRVRITLPEALIVG
jgi:signal transduction histidine kinase